VSPAITNQQGYGSAAHGCLYRRQTRLEERLDRFQVGIAPGDFAERRVHFEAFLEMLLRVFRVSEQRLIATHVVIIDWLFAERGRAFEQKLFGFSGFAELMQTKTSMKKSGAALGRGAAKFATYNKRATPAFPPHQMMQAQLQNFGSILRLAIDGIQLGKRLACHA
jgi:hypothetical protein